MGVFTKEAEVSTPLPPAKAFKAFAVDIENLMPKVAPQTVKSVEVLEGNGGPGTIRKITFAEGHGLSHAKHKVDVLDKDNLVYAYTVMESDFFNKKIEKISYDIKFVAAADGGSTVKVAATFYTAGDTEVTPDLMAQIKEASEKRALVMKAIESYVLANPDA